MDDISSTLTAKSNQLNADDLLGGPITVRIVRVVAGDSAEQPVAVHIDGGHRPWMPCKTTRRILAALWGPKTGPWIGRSITLYRDADVKWGGQAVGGIRIKAMSHIDGPARLALQETKKSKSMHEIQPLRVENAAPVNPLPGFLDAVRTKLDLDPTQVQAWASSAGVGLASMDRAALGAMFKALSPGGAHRAELDAFLAAPTLRENGPTGDYDELPEGEGFPLDGAK